MQIKIFDNFYLSFFSKKFHGNSNRKLGRKKNKISDRMFQTNASAFSRSQSNEKQNQVLKLHIKI